MNKFHIGFALMLVNPVLSYAETVIVVQPGETLSSISMRELGDANRWSQICEANRLLLADCDIVQPGVRLTIPTDPTLTTVSDVQTAPGLNSSRRNLISSVNNFAGDWSGYYTKPSVTQGYTDPFGGTEAFLIDSADAETSPGGARSGFILGGETKPGTYTYGAWVRATEGKIDVRVGLDDGFTEPPVTVGNEWMYVGGTATTTIPTKRRFQIFETTLANSPWEIYGASVELGLFDTPLYKGPGS